MDVSKKISQENKQRLNSLQVEIQVIQNLLTERKEMQQSMIKEILVSLVPNPQQYALKMNAAQDVWELQLRPDALVIPGINPKILTRNLHGN